jgi:hypothetical protein
MFTYSVHSAYVTRVTSLNAACKYGIYVSCGDAQEQAMKESTAGTVKRPNTQGDICNTVTYHSGLHFVLGFQC